MPRTKLIFIDVDGTLLDDECRVTPAVKQAVGRARDAGLTVILASGRRYRSMRELSLELGLSTYAVCQHGSIIKRLRDDRTVAIKPIEPRAARAVGAMIAEAGLEPIFYVDGYEEGRDFYFAGEPARPGSLEYARVNAGVWGIDKRIPDGRAVIGVVAFDEAERLSPLEDRCLRSWPETVKCHIMQVPQYSYPTFEAISAGAGKGNALLEVAALLGVPTEETAAIGDGRNDVEMLEAAGVAAAMGNAHRAVGEAADFVVGSNNDDGAAEAIDRILALE